MKYKDFEIRSYTFLGVGGPSRQKIRIYFFEINLVAIIIYLFTYIITKFIYEDPIMLGSYNIIWYILI